MDILSENINGIISNWLNLTTFFELILIGLCGFLAYLAGNLTSRWIRTGRNHAAFVRLGLLQEVILIAAPYATALLLLLVLRFSTGLLGHDPRLLNLALRLFSSLVLIRGVAFFLRLSLDPHSRLRAWEVRATVFAWFFVAMHILGLLEAFGRGHSHQERRSTSHLMVIDTIAIHCCLVCHHQRVGGSRS